MLKNIFAAIVALTTLLAFANAECPNACSSHGKCGAYDMCICYRNWMSNDCSERVCQFGLAHVDSPRGDLDASGGKLSGPSTTVIENDAVYPYGTQEQYPSMVDSEDVVLENTAHAYAECSNKGICDRSSGTCACFDGYSGSACQRLSCPSNSAGVCSGHGTCETIRNLANNDYGNIYRLWDEDITMGCKCDGGYSGSDCSEKVCKYGADPLYYDDAQNIQYSNFTYQIYALASTAITGNYSLWFQDHTGEDWQTGPIDILASCDDVTTALESIPNKVIPSNSVRCYQPTTFTTANSPIYNSGIFIGGSNLVLPKFTLVFGGNPGRLRQIAINKYLDGTRPTLYTAETTSTLNWHIYANGFKGEDIDFVPDLCEGVSVTLTSSSTTLYVHKLDSISVAEAKLLKTCLGDSNGDSSDNVEVYDWDYGNVAKFVELETNSANDNNFYATMNFPNPHLIKLMDRTQDSVTFTDEVDPALYAYPKTRLCTRTKDYILSSADTIGWWSSGWCADRNPPSFLAVLYFDKTNEEFNIFTRPAAHFSTTTPFAVYTTTGYLNRVSRHVNAVSYNYVTESTAARINHLHSNVMYLQNSTAFGLNNFSRYYGAIDCETNPIGSGVFANDCLNKDDHIMFLNIVEDTAGQAANPIYPNMYQVKKIFNADAQEPDKFSQLLRHRIVLDVGTNTEYTSAAPAVIYKFHPPTNGGYKYVAQCSNRGICDKSSGLCQCFPGYTGDNCGTQDALMA